MNTSEILKTKQPEPILPQFDYPDNAIPGVYSTQESQTEVQVYHNIPEHEKPQYYIFIIGKENLHIMKGGELLWQKDHNRQK